MNQKRIKCSKIEFTFTVPCTNVVSQEPAQEREQEPAQERAQELAQERALPSQMVNHRVIKRADCRFFKPLPFSRRSISKYGYRST